jgi:fructoselysine-6-P-deglycase FrlB-like protein
MTEMIAAEPALAQRLLGRLGRHEALGRLADAIRAAAAAGQPVVTTGCGTSEHAAAGIALLLTEALRLPPGRAVRSLQALEGLGATAADAVLVAVSHEGGTLATNEALTDARAAGARTALVTVSDRSPAAALADIVVTTEEMDRSWCHTVGYLSPLLVGVALAARIAGGRVDGRAVRALLDVTEDSRSAASVAAGLSGIDRVVVAGSGPDLVSARELALKISEGARLPAQALDLESVLHGYLAAATRWTGLVVIRTETATGPNLVGERTRRVLEAGVTIGMPTAAILGARVSDELAPELSSAGRLVIPPMGRLKGAASALLGPVIPLQLLAERLARARGVDPDTLGREDEAQAAAHAG